MANNQGPQPKDYSLLLDFNFDQLNNRPAFDGKLLLDENLDWYLIEVLNEMELMGSSNEQTLNALLTMIGSLSNDSYCRNLLTGAPVWLNIFSHVLGTTGSNKSYLANEIIYALKTLDNTYPGVYSNRQNVNNIDDLEEQSRKKQKIESWSSSASSITEAALFKNTNHTDVMIVNPDGDNALKLLSYYEQNSTGGAQGVSSFCTGYDGIEPGSSRVTGVESSKNQRPRPSKLSMYIVSTGKKFSLPLMKMIDEGANDGIYGRVWYNHTNTVRELPDIIIKKQISLPNFTHVGFCSHYFFQNKTIEFRYALFRTDFDFQSHGQISSRMQAARREQNVNYPEFYGISMDEHDIIQQQHPFDYTNNDSSNKLSPFALASQVTNEIWNQSFTLEKHIGEMWRKIPYHLPKSIVLIKVLRLFFRIMGEKMLFYMNSQEGNRSYPAKSIGNTFHQKLNQTINEYLEQHSRIIEIQNKKIHVLLLTSEDVEAGYKWCRLKLETTYTLFSTTQIKNIVNERLGKTPTDDSSLTKSVADQRMASAMAKIMMTPTIFFSNSYLSSNVSRGGSGLFMQKRITDLKYDCVVEKLLEKEFLMGCNVIQNSHLPKNKKLSPSYYKQQPSYFLQSETRLKELQDMGINFNQYKRNYENSLLPKNAFFNNNGIDLIQGDEWIPFYHTFLNDPKAKLLIENRINMNQIIEFDGRFGLNNINMDVIEFNDEQESIADNFQPPSYSSPIDMNDKPSSMTILPVDPEISSLGEHNDEENTSLSSGINNHRLPSTINQACSIESISTVSTCSIESTSSNSINKIIDILNSSSIGLGFSNQNYVVEDHQNHQSTQPHIDDAIVDIVQTVLNIVCNESIPIIDTQSINLPTIKKRGRRPLLKSTVRPSITTSEINNILEDDNHPIWKKLILNKHVLATMSDLSRTVTGSDEINAARLACIEKLLNIGCILNGDEFLNGKEKAVLKNSPEDPRLLSALNKYKIDVEDYKQSFNNHSPFGYKNGVPIPVILNISTNKNKFTPMFVDKLQSDPFFSMYLRVDPEHVVKSSSLKRKTTSSHETDLFRTQKQRKTVITKKNDKKYTEELINKDVGTSTSKTKGARTRQMASNQ